MKLSVVILNYNVRYFLELCIKSVERAIEKIDAEIIVIDNNSPDDSCTMVKQVFPHITLIENNENVGFSKANNQAVKQAKGEYVCILNPDTVVAEDTFIKIFEFADSKADIGIVGCRLIDGTGSFLPESKRNVPTVKVASLKMMGNSDRYYANHIEETDIAEASIFVGAFMVIKKKIYEALNGFDEDFFMYGEDIDFSYRAIKLGYRNYYFGETTIIHYKGESTLKDKTYAKRFYEAMKIFYKKHFSTNLLFNTLVWFGITSAKLFSKPSKPEKKNNSKHIVYSYKLHINYNSLFPFNVKVKNQLKSVESNTEIIFDLNTLTYKEIIEKMLEFANIPQITFRILPQNSSFILGSDDSVNQGEILTLESFR